MQLKATFLLGILLSTTNPGFAEEEKSSCDRQCMIDCAHTYNTPSGMSILSLENCKKRCKAAESSIQI